MTRHMVVPIYLLACLLLGGASQAGIAANLLLQIMAIPLIGWALWRLAQDGTSAQIRIPLALMGLLIVIALLQLVPLPPAIWTALPGRGSVVEGYRLLGVPLPWLPLTLAPYETLASILWLLPAFATLLAVIVLGAFRGRAIAAVIVAVTLVSVAIGAVQVVGGTSAYIYEKTSFGIAVGFFANGNHYATLMLVCIPFLAAWQTALLKRSRSARNASAIRLLVVAAYAVILVGLLTNASLAGIGLSVPVTLGTWLVFGRQRPQLRRGLAIVAAVATIAALLTIAIGPFGNNLFGEQKKDVELTRQTSFALTWRVAKNYLPIGSGTGSFVPIYRTQEPLSTIGRTYMNHAHNDWLELLLETGIVGIVLAAAFLTWWVSRVRAIWRAEEPDRFAQAAVIATAAIMLHSTVDYPLRTAALSAVFAMCIGLMSGIRPYVRPRRSEQTARHLSL
ncbi:O-antigen ligase [Sphingomonas gellani]|uniref:O-antigen ligase n=1 Tax=Sphingomonas gellani TaxID=1166340 RepID=A0A1H8I4Y4_9SPHN|nr:O-antigen ligase family protein [Sphingomonas gellani]SEN63341.1 O-antigen ligase [Sphingomonas gellani]